MMLPPGSTIGVLGSGQLGRMFTHAAHQMGYRVHIYSPNTDTPAGQSADLEVTASYEDADSLHTFARHVDVVTYELEHVPLSALDVIENHIAVRPGYEVLATAQNRVVEKSRLQRAGLPVPDFAAVNAVSDIHAFLSHKKTSDVVVLKTAEQGYDGKGQTLVDGIADADAALDRINQRKAIVEELIDFDYELSVIGSRSLEGHFEYFGPVLNFHRNHILDVSVAPAKRMSPAVRAEAIEITKALLEELDACGVVCVEFFYTTDGRLLINEIAPRPHNSGHLTLEASTTSQFEQQVRAVCGLPLGSMEQSTPAAMANLLGMHLAGNSLQWQNVLNWPTVKLHLYGKGVPHPGRKMGHLTATAPQAEIAESLVRSARKNMRLDSGDDFTENHFNYKSESHIEMDSNRPNPSATQ